MNDLQFEEEATRRAVAVAQVESATKVQVAAIERDRAIQVEQEKTKQVRAREKTAREWAADYKVGAIAIIAALLLLLGLIYSIWSYALADNREQTQRITTCTNSGKVWNFNSDKKVWECRPTASN